MKIGDRVEVNAPPIGILGEVGRITAGPRVDATTGDKPWYEVELASGEFVIAIERELSLLER